MNFPYSKILKQAYEIVRLNKFFWIFGLFLIWGNFSSLLSFVAKLNNQRTNVQPQDLNPWMIWSIFALLLIVIVLNYRAKVAAIISVKGLLDKQETGFRKGFKHAGKYYIRAFGSALALMAIMFLITAVLAGPVAYLHFNDLSSRAVMLATLAFIILIPASIVVTYVNILSAHFISLYDQTIGESISSGFNLVLKKWPQLVIFSVLLWFRILIAFFAAFFVVFLIILAASQFDSPVVYGSGVFVAGLIFLASSAIISALHQASWTLAFMELVKPVKLAEPEVLPAPEAA